MGEVVRSRGGLGRRREGIGGVSGIGERMRRIERAWGGGGTRKKELGSKEEYKVGKTLCVERSLEG